ncbi:MAG: DUF4436 family protein [Akkermansiaceae bacterium]
MNPAKMRRRWIIVALLATALLTAYLAVLINFRAESALELRSAENLPPTSDHVVVQLDILEIDPVMQNVRLRFFPKPAGELQKNKLPVPGRALTLRVDGAHVSLGSDLSERRTQTIYDDEGNMAPVDAVAVLTNGSVGNFPFDHYLFNFRLSVTTPDPADPRGYRSLPVTVEPSPDAGQAGYALSGEVTRVSAADGVTPEAVELKITVRRSPAAFWYTILLLVIAGALSICCAAVAVVVAFDQRFFQPAFFAWMSATLFAVVGLRRVLPGNPPFGSLPDFLVFMWAEFLVASALVSLVVAYLRRKPQP